MRRRLDGKNAGRSVYSNTTLFDFVPHTAEPPCNICDSVPESKNKKGTYIANDPPIDHWSMLQNICRVCGAWKQYHYPKQDYAGQLNKVLDIDISEDDEEIHGGVICDNHVRLLKKHIDGKNVTSNIVLYNFVPHSKAPFTQGCDLRATFVRP